MPDDDETPRRGRRFSDAETIGYAVRDSAKQSRGADIAVAGIQTSGAILRELIAVAKANPIIGVVLAAVVVDVLYQTKVIRPQTSTFLFTCIGAAFAISAAEGTVDIFAQLLPWSSSAAASSNADLIKPIPTTLVENPPIAANQSVPAGATMGPGSGAGASIGQIAGLLAALPK